jgi:predicted DNA-binding protein
MDKIFSTRVDEAVVRRISYLARRLSTSKKAVIERAISDLAERMEAGDDDYEIVESFGAWRRDESAEKSRNEARKAFQSAMERHHK